MPAADTYFISWKGRRDGPYTLKELAELLQQGEIGLLHRVETPAGLVPLRDLLPAAELNSPAPVKASAESGLLGPVSVPEPLAPPPPPRMPEPEFESLDSQQAARLYTICGFCFLFPPLAGWSWMLANELNGQGQQVTGARMKKLSLALAVGGIVLWLLIWRLW